MTTLIELTDQLTRIEQAIETQENLEESEARLDALLSQQEETYDAYLDKLDSIVALIKSRKQWAKIRQEESKRMAALAQTDLNTVAWLEKMLQAHMDCKGTTRLRTKQFNLSSCQNGGNPPIKLDDISVDELPTEFVKTSISPDKEAIRKALEAGKKLDFARFVGRGRHLRIK